jgi:hypothetical protein
LEGVPPRKSNRGYFCLFWNLGMGLVSGKHRHGHRGVVHCCSPSLLLLAAFMSNKSQNPATPQRPDKPATHSEQRAQSKAKPDQPPPDSTTETTQKTPPVAGRKARVNQQAATTLAPAPASVAAAPAPVVYNSAPNGIANSGTIQQATVNNYGPPPPPTPTVSICLTQLPVSDGRHTLELTFDTTENITEPWYALYFSGPIIDGRNSAVAFADNTGAFGFLRTTAKDHDGDSFVFRLTSVNFGTGRWVPGRKIRALISSTTEVRLTNVISGAEEQSSNEKLVYPCGYAPVSPQSR